MSSTCFNVLSIKCSLI
uniref:Uncharacterized protein n=1 Tax=Anguilla anguilla TaxID=7936 RepID=A0A0E9U562_ANGAN